MRVLLTIVTLVALGWSAFWAVGQIGVSKGYEGWLEARRAEGWVAETANVQTQGFPNRFDTSFTKIVLADPDTGLAWEAPFFQILALSYKPNHVIAVWPDSQLLATPIDKFRVESEDMRASFVTAADVSLPVERITLTADKLAVTPELSGETTRVDALRLGADRVAASEATYRLGLAADGLSPALDWRVKLDPGGNLPEAFDAFSADMTVKFDKPWDRTAIEDARPQPRKIDLRLAEARWGRLELQAAGVVEVDAQGVPEGNVTIKARNWREILQMAVESGALRPGIADTLEKGLGLISQMAGNPKTLDIPLNFRNGFVRLGVVPIGPAPVLRLR